MRVIHHPMRSSLRSSILGLFLASLVGSACDCKGNNGEIDPSDARASDLYGWWTHTDSSGNMTVFGFVPKDDAARVLPIKPEEATADISAVYQGAGTALAEPVQLATFEVKDGEILQTVIRDANATAGTQFRTRIVSLEPQRELSLQSTNAATGSRSFSWAARCPSSAPNGYFDVPGQICRNYFSAGSSLAVDLRGGVHSASSVLGRATPCAPDKPAVPTYGHFASACGPTLSPLPDFRQSALATDESTVHFAYVSLSAYDSSKDGFLFYRYRPLDQRGDWIEEPVAGQGYPVHELRVLLQGGQPLIVVSRTNGVIELYRREAGTWKLVPTLLPNGMPLEGRMADATLDREGRLVLLLESNHMLAYERAGGFELIELPRSLMTGFGGGVAADGSGRVHVTYVYELIGDNEDGTGGRVVSGRGLYALYDGTAWTSYELGPITYPRMVTRGDGPWRVVHGLTKAAVSTLALTEVSRDGSLRSELITLEPSFGVGGSPEPFYHITAAIGPDGTIAAAWDGNRVYIRPPEDQLEPERTRLDITIEGRGKGRVRSADGTIDCTETCAVEVPVGARYQLFFEPEAQSAREVWPCPSNYFTLYGYCWYDVFPGVEHKLTVKFRDSLVASVLPVGADDGSSQVKCLAARDGRVAVAATVTSGRLLFGDEELNVGSAQQVLAVREADGRAWAVPVPIEPQAIGFHSDGSAAALFFANYPLTFPSGTVGNSPGGVLALAYYANGGFQRVEVVAHVPNGSSWVAGAVGDDDAAAAVLGNFSSFGELGIPEYMLFAYRNAAGNVVLRGLGDDSLAVASSGAVSLAAGRASVSLNNALLQTFDGGGTLTGTRRAAEASVRSHVVGADRVYSTWGTYQGGIDLGGGPMPSQGSGIFYAEHGLDGRFLFAQEVTPSGIFAVAPAPSGTIFAEATFRGGLGYGRLLDSSYTFSYGGDLAGNKATPFLADIDGSSFWIAVKHQGTVDYDLATIQAPYRQLLIQMRLP